MPTLGEILRSERENGGYTTSQVAESTRIKIQQVEDLENDDFSRIAAPIYGKGFVKLYAEFLKLDPAPLVEMYVQAGTDAPTPTLKSMQRRKARVVQPDPWAGETSGAEDRKRILEQRGKSSSARDFLGIGNQRQGEGGVVAAVRTTVTRVAERIAEGVEAVSAMRQQDDDRDTGSTPEPTSGTRRSRWPMLVALSLVVLLIISGLSRCGRGADLAVSGTDGTDSSGRIDLTEDPPDPYLE